MRRPIIFALMVTAAVGSQGFAITESSIFPWQLLSGGYDSSVNDGRILALPSGIPAGDSGFFQLVEDSIMTMTADNGGFSRSALASGVDGNLKPGDRWENSNGGRGLTDEFCGGYAGCGSLALQGGGTVSALKLGVTTVGPPSAIDTGHKNFSPSDVAAGGWPETLLSQLATLRQDVPS